MKTARILPRDAAAVALFAGLTALGAFVRIPVTAVPLTLQTAAVLLSGIMLGPKLGALSQVIYVLIGLTGAPVFAGGGGPGYVLHPTFGYLVGFVGGSAVTGLAAGNWREASLPRLLFSMLAGLAVIYAVGVAYLYWNLTAFQQKEIPLAGVMKIGFLIPLPQDLVKILLLLPLIKAMRKRVAFQL